MKIVLTTDEVKNLNKAHQEGGKPALSTEWQKLSEKYSFSLSTLKHVSGYEYSAEPLIQAPPPMLPENEPPPQMALEIIYPNALPKPAAINEVSENESLQKFNYLLQARDNLVKLIDSVVVTDHNSNAQARDLGVKATKFINEFEAIVEEQKRPWYQTWKNLIAAGKTIIDPIRNAIGAEGMGKKIKLFEDEIQKIKDEQKAKAAADSQKAQDEINKQNREQQGFTDLANKYLTSFKQDISSATTKAAITSLIKSMQSFSPAQLGNMQEYFDKGKAECIELAKQKLTSFKADPTLFETQQSELEQRKIEREEGYKKELMTWLEIIGEVPVEEKAEKYKTIYGSFEIAHGMRQKIREQVDAEKKTKIELNRASQTGLKNRRKVTDFSIKDETLIPHEYYSLDEKKIKAAMKVNKEGIETGQFIIPGIEWTFDTKTVYK